MKNNCLLKKLRKLHDRLYTKSCDYYIEYFNNVSKLYYIGKIRGKYFIISSDNANLKFTNAIMENYEVIEAIDNIYLHCKKYDFDYCYYTNKQLEEYSKIFSKVLAGTEFYKNKENL